MMGQPSSPTEERLLLLTPTGRDAALAHAILDRAGVPATRCADVAELCEQLELGAAAILLPEEVVLEEHRTRLLAWLERQPPWSDLPVLILSRVGANSAAVAQAIQLFGNVTVLERPIRVAALVSTVRTALRARRRQYQLRDQLDQIAHSERELHEADRRKDEFLAILAHELRNPLAPIRNSLHILRLTGSQDANAEHLAAVMERQINHLVRLVDDLMEVSRITRGKIELRKELIELAAVVRSAVETSRPSIDASRHRLTVVIPPEPFTLDGDPVRLAQVFSNLLNNAAKYTPEGGEIRLTVKRLGSEVLIAVRDNGMGIPLEMQPRVFDLFTQVERSAARAQGGLGIGLTLVRRLVEMHGGSVAVRSKGEGQGTEFLVRLPLVPTAAPAPPDQSRVRPLAVLAPRRVLVADDNKDGADSLGALLQLLGAEVRVAYGGTQALELFATWHPAVVLLDIGMPDLDGCAVAEEIRRRPDGREITLIALTGWGQEEDRLRSFTAGFDHHLIKPANVDALEDLLVSLGSDEA